MIKKVSNYKDLKTFIYFVKQLYGHDSRYPFPIFFVLKKELKKEVLIEKNYTALLSIQNGEVKGRILYTVDSSKKHKSQIGYFSFFDAYQEVEVARELFEYMEKDLISRGMKYVEGTFAPYDPDTRRGILVEGFDIDPTIMTSYNAPYYGELIEHSGYSKAYDTFSLEAEISDTTEKRMNTLETYFEKRFNIRIDSISFKHMDKDIQDVHTILKEASTEVNYQEAPSIELIENVAKSMKMFINPDIIKIARVEETNEPIGFCLCLPDYNQVFRKTKGRINPIELLRAKKTITTVRGVMQYVVPKYQNTGLIGVMFKKVYDNFKPLGITRFEAGTILEENPKSMATFFKFGGHITKTYRIYGKELTK